MQAHVLLWRRDPQEWRLLIAPWCLWVAINVVEESKELVEISLLHRIVLVVMTNGTLQCHPHEYGSKGGYLVHDVTCIAFLRRICPLVHHHMQAVVARSNLLIKGRIGMQIPCELIGHKLIEGHVRIVSTNHPVAILRLLAIVIMMHAIRVSKSHEI